MAGPPFEHNDIPDRAEMPSRGAFPYPGHPDNIDSSPVSRKAPGDSNPGPPDGGAASAQPADLGTAWILWLAVAALNGVHLVSTLLLFRYNDYALVLSEQLEVGSSELADSEVELVFTISKVLVGLFLSTFVALWLFFAYKSVNGRLWARVLTDFGGIALLFIGIVALFGVLSGSAIGDPAGDDSVVVFLSLASQILTGLCAAVAIWLQHTSESSRFYAQRSGLSR